MLPIRLAELQVLDVILELFRSINFLFSRYIIIIIIIITVNKPVSGAVSFENKESMLKVR